MHRRATVPGSGWCALAAAAAVLAGVPVVVAQEAPGAGETTSVREQARVLYETGAAAFDAGDYAAALQKLQESYRLFASLRTLYSLGLCQHALGDFAAATRSLDQYLREAGADAPTELRTRAEELLGQMRAQMGKLDVRANVEGAEILVDGVVVGSSPLAEPVDIGPGWHVVEARRTGYRSEPQRANVTTGETATVALALVALPVETHPEPGPGAGTSPPPPVVVPEYGPPPGVTEQEWYGIGDADYQAYVFETGRRQSLANWVLERNRENPDLDLAEILAGSQGPAWLLAGTLVYVRYEYDFEKNGDRLPWFSTFEWMLGSALTLGAIVMAIIDALDVDKVNVAHPERLVAVPAGAHGSRTGAGESSPSAAAAPPPLDLSVGFGGLTLRF
jgi:tetratricopeptide (TPR) repeat protein